MHHKGLLALFAFSCLAAACSGGGTPPPTSPADSLSAAIDTAQTLVQDSTLAVADTTTTALVDTTAMVSSSHTNTATATPAKPTPPKKVSTPPKKSTTPKVGNAAEAAKGGSKSVLPKTVFNKWRLDTSVGERSGGRTYKPEGSFEVRPARMWAVIDIRPDGTISIKEPGPTDSGITLVGKWTAPNASTLVASLGDGSKRTYNIVTTSNNELVLQLK